MSGITITEKEGRRVFRGINKEAKRLGVTRMHLWRVLVGQRQSKRLMREVRICENNPKGA